MTITNAERRRAAAAAAEAAAAEAATGAEEGLQEGQKEAEVWHLKVENWATIQNKDILQISGEWTGWCWDFSVHHAEEFIIKCNKTPLVLGFAFVERSLLIILTVVRSRGICWYW